jgi:glycosyltransferase involved in cell wall biosynthesis
MEKISGFSLVRNGIQFDYPFLESWRSLLPLVDELVLAIGESDDDSLLAAQKFAHEEGQNKEKIIESVWPLNDPIKKKSGLILSEQTNLALAHCQNDWCFYLQADEVLHEADYQAFKNSFRASQADPKIEAVVYGYQHFYGSFNVVQETRSAYRREVRLIKKSSSARSVGDAQSFLKSDGTKLNALLSEARIFHYGWVRTPEAMREKTDFMDQLYHGDAKEGAVLPQSGDNFRYKRFWGLQSYLGTHPSVMQTRIAEKGWNWDLMASPFVFKTSDFKKIILDGFEKVTGHRPFEFKNYRICGTVKS